MKNLFSLIYPQSIYCISCGAIINQYAKYSLCGKCISKFQWIEKRICQKCGRIISSEEKICKDCENKTHEFTKGYVCAQYGLYERTVMMDYKYGGEAYLGRIIGRIMAERISIEKLNIDLILPVPIHKERKKKRGYNQAEIISKTMGKEIDVLTLNKAIKRKKNTKPMKSLDSSQREENVKEAFIIEQRYYAKIKGKNILIIDDIYTTGSTVNSVAKCLVEGGSGEVNFLVFAAGKI